MTDDFDRRLDSFDTRLRLQEKIVTELFESVRILNNSVQSLERSNEKRVAVDEALKDYITELRAEQKEQKAENKADRDEARANTSIWQTNRGFWLAVGGMIFILVNVVLNTVSVLGR